MSARTPFAILGLLAVGFAAGRVSRPGVAEVIPVTATSARDASQLRELGVKLAPAQHETIARAEAEPEPVLPSEPEVEPEPTATAVHDEPQPTAQPAIQNTGVLKGQVHDVSTGEPLPGVTVVATAPDSQTFAGVTDNSGEYTIANLPRSSYRVTFYYMSQTIERPGIWIDHDWTTTLPMELSVLEGDHWVPGPEGEEGEEGEEGDI